MIKSIERISKNPKYLNIIFEDDQDYYRSVIYLDDKYGRSGKYFSKNNIWYHNADKLTIQLQEEAVISFLATRYGWKLTVVRIGSSDDAEFHEWCKKFGYPSRVDPSFYNPRLATICVPSEKEVVWTKLRWS